MQTQAENRTAEAKDQDEQKLMDAALGHLRKMTILLKRTAVEQFLAGQALAMLRSKLKAKGTWVQWQKENGLHPNTVNDCIHLFEKAGSVEAVMGLKIMEARERFGVIKPKSVQPETPAALEEFEKAVFGEDNNPDEAEEGESEPEDDEVAERSDYRRKSVEVAQGGPPPPRTSPVDALAKLVVGLELIEDKLNDEGLGEDDRDGLLRNIEIGLASLDRLRAVVLGRKEVRS